MAKKNIFTAIIRGAAKSGQRKVRGLVGKATSLFKSKMIELQNKRQDKKDKKFSIKDILKQASRGARKDSKKSGEKYSGIQPGDMMQFVYDPKGKKTLPYYDRMPIVFPIGLYKDGFLGLNFHYLKPISRAKLLDALLSNVDEDNLDDDTKMDINYRMLKGVSKYKEFKPTIKRYLNSHVKSKFIKIHPEEWEVVIFLPTAKWEKATQREIWKDSQQIINK